MNERIRELAMQADIWCDQNVAQGSPMYNNQWEYKFAELVVRDIIGIVESYCETTPEIYGLPLDILEHFDMELPDE